MIVRMYRKKKSMISPIAILIPHFFKFHFAFTSSPPAHAHAMPSPTIPRTPRSITIKTNHRIICANIFWKLQNPG